MQEEDLRHKYKAAFDSIAGKPVPDIWDAIEAELPREKPNNKMLLYLSFAGLILIVSGVAYLSIQPQRDYFPRTAAAYNLSQIKPLAYFKAPVQDNILNSSKSSDTYEHVSDNNIYSSPRFHEEENVGGAAGGVSATIQAEEPIASSESQSLPLSKSVIPLSDERLSNCSKLEISLLPVLRELEIKSMPELALTEPKNKGSFYIGFGADLYSSKLIDSKFRKGLDPNSLVRNQWHVEPAFSLFAGVRINSANYLETSLDLVNVGQSYSEYEEGSYIQRSNNYKYLALTLKDHHIWNPLNDRRMLFTDLGVRVGVLMNKSEFSESTKGYDASMHVGSGIEFKVAEKLWLGTSIDANYSMLSVTNRDKNLPWYFDSSNHLNVGVGFHFKWLIE